MRHTKHTVTMFGSRGPLAVFRHVTEMEEVPTGVHFNDEQGNVVTLRKGTFPLLIEGEPEPKA